MKSCSLNYSHEDVVVVVTGFVTWKAEDSQKKREFVSLKFD